MKVLKNIFTYIIITLLTVLISAFFMIRLLSSTILSKDYVLAKLDETDYYNKVYSYVESNFEKYIYQSGLDESVIKNIITVEQVKEDTQSILDNIYDNAKKEIKVEEVKQNLIENIEQSLDENVTVQQSSIESFAKTIGDEYVKSISHYKYEEKMNNGYMQIVKTIEKCKRIIVFLMTVCIVLLFILNIKTLYQFFVNIGTSILASGIIAIFVKCFISSKIDVKNISVLNVAFSDSVRNIALQILQKILQYGLVCGIIGILLIMIFNYIKINKKNIDEKKS